LHSPHALSSKRFRVRRYFLWRVHAVEYYEAQLDGLGQRFWNEIDQHIPESVAELLREIANIANLVGEFFAGDEHKVALWFEIANPMLGNISPSNMIRIGKHKRLLTFVVSAREENSAALQ
jgi:hypothetical protein